MIFYNAVDFYSISANDWLSPVRYKYAVLHYKRIPEFLICQM